jgi:hypothetical protein
VEWELEQLPPKHAKTNYCLKQGIFENLKSFSNLEKKISRLPTDKERGDAFEVFAEAYLATQTIMQAKEVWPFDKIPAPVKRKFRLDIKKDMGVDGLLQTTTDEHHAKVHSLDVNVIVKVGGLQFPSTDAAIQPGFPS